MSLYQNMLIVVLFITALLNALGWRDVLLRLLRRGNLLDGA